ncbi:hypothetical protein [Spiroplasma endosymbiont of Stenodema calcarata]|uniref:hypothetical protein n=1 Tax=Spiroplasma endosymbiont of Stenodema calcarata TaxID=3139328 RepID=UPI003CCACC94
MYLVIKDSDNIKDHYKITDLISKNTDHEEKENFWYKFGYTVINNLFDINWQKEPDKNIEPVR